MTVQNIRIATGGVESFEIDGTGLNSKVIKNQKPSGRKCGISCLGVHFTTAGSLNFNISHAFDIVDLGDSSWS